jgi:hypothetical protein
VAIEMVRNAREADFRFVPQKVLFPFSEYKKLSFFVKQLPKREIKRWAQHPTYIIDHLGYAYQLLFHCGNLWWYLLNFAQARADFGGSGP